MNIGAVDPVAVPMIWLAGNKQTQSLRIDPINPQIDGLTVHMLAVGNSALVGVPFLAT